MIRHAAFVYPPLARIYAAGADLQSVPFVFYQQNPFNHGVTRSLSRSNTEFITVRHRWRGFIIRASYTSRLLIRGQQISPKFGTLVPGFD